MFDVLDMTTHKLPQDRPRYLMGVGTPDDILGAVERGVDMFDCVIPTRSGRLGRAYTSHGVMNINNAKYKDDPRPIDPRAVGGTNPTDNNYPCQHYSRAYIHHLFKANEMLGPILLSWHNLAYYQQLMHGIRNAIRHGETEPRWISLPPSSVSFVTSRGKPCTGASNRNASSTNVLINFSLRHTFLTLASYLFL